MPTLGLAMIVKNGAETLRSCLESAVGAVDAIVIGDTGSTDESMAIAREFGATILEIPWTDDFSEARNAVLRAMKTDWVLVLDADQELAAGAASWIREAIRKDAAGYMVEIRNYISPRLPAPIDQIMLGPGELHAHAPDAVAYVPSPTVPLFRRDPELFYRGCVHETIDAQIVALGGRIERGGFLIHHFGWYLADGQQTKEKRQHYFELLEKRLKESPNEANSLMQYGFMLYEDHGKVEEGLAALRRAAEINPNTPGAWLWAGLILTKLRRFEEALEALARVPEQDFPHLRVQLLGNSYFGLERFEEAREAYEQALRLSPNDRMLGSKLGMTEVRLGRTDEGIERIRTAADGWPPLEGVDQMLVGAYLAADWIAEALEAGESFAQRYSCADAWVEVARTHAQRGDWEKALSTLDMGLEQLPDAVELYDFRTTTTIALRNWGEAVRSARAVAELAPSPNALLTLATILIQAGERGEAERILAARERALSPTPNRPLAVK